MTWKYTPTDQLTIKTWSADAVRDAEKDMFFAPYMMAAPGADRAFRSPDYNKGVGIIDVHTQFQSQKGDRVTIPNVGLVTGRGLHNDGLLRDLSNVLPTSGMDLFFENVANRLVSEGQLSQQRIALDFNREARYGLARWGTRKVEESIILALAGLTQWDTVTGPTMKCCDDPVNGRQSESSLFLNTVQPFTAATTMYAGDATSLADIDSSDRMSAQLLSRIETRATEELDIPIEPLRIGGEDCYVLLMSGKSAEDLRLDPDYREAQAGFGKGESPLVKRGFGKFGMIIPVIYPKMPSPVNPNVAAGAAGNLSRALLLGKSALQFAKVSPWEFFENDADDAKRRTAISIGSMMGMTPTLFNGVRRNALAIDHYVR